MEDFATIDRISAISDKLAAGCKLSYKELRWLLQWNLGVSGSAANEMVHMLLRYRRTIYQYAKRD